MWGKIAGLTLLMMGGFVGCQCSSSITRRRPDLRIDEEEPSNSAWILDNGHNIHKLDLNTLQFSPNPLFFTSCYAALRNCADRMCLIQEDDCNSVLVIDPDGSFGPAGVDEIFFKEDSYPGDLATLSFERAFATFFTPPSLRHVVEVNLGTGKIGPQYDLTPLLDPAEKEGPLVMRAIVVGPLLFVGMRYEQEHVDVPRGKVAVIDTNTNSLVDADPTTPETDAIRLEGSHLVELAYWEEGNLIYAVLSGKTVAGAIVGGGIEAIDPETLRSRGLFAEVVNATDNHASKLVVAPEGEAFLRTTKSFVGPFYEEIHRIRLDSSGPEYVSRIYENECIGDLAFHRGLDVLLVADNTCYYDGPGTTNPGIPDDFPSILLLERDGSMTARIDMPHISNRVGNQAVPIAILPWED